MTWTKLSDDFPDDCWSLSDAAFRLHVSGLCWSNRKLLDCRIPEDDLLRLAKSPEAVAELLERGWWKQEDGAFLIQHHRGYQRLAKDVIHQQNVNKSNRRKGRTRPVEPDDEPFDESSEETNGQTNRQTKGTGTGTGQDRHLREAESSETNVIPKPLPPSDLAEELCADYLDSLEAS